MMSLEEAVELVEARKKEEAQAERKRKDAEIRAVYEYICNTEGILIDPLCLVHDGSKIVHRDDGGTDTGVTYLADAKHNGIITFAGKLWEGDGGLVAERDWLYGFAWKTRSLPRGQIVWFSSLAEAVHSLRNR